MKPIFQLGRPVRRGDSQYSFGLKLPNFPAVEWSFHPAAAPMHPGGSASLRRRNLRPSLLRSFRRLSENFFASEARRESRLEGALFAVIAALGAWPIVLAMRAAAGLVK